MIKVRNVSKIYKLGASEFKALDNVSLKINNGEFVAILGPSGSGKSTLMHLIGGLDKPTSGSIEIEDLLLNKLNDKGLATYRNEKIGFVFQSFNLLQNANSLDNVTLPLIYSRKKLNRRAKAEKILKEVGLESKLKNLPNQLSGGEQQRLAIARALVNDPEIILADEPTGNLDSKTGSQIFELLKSLNERGKTLIVVTHDHSLAQKAKRIIKMKDGQIEN